MRNHTEIYLAFWALIALYAAARVLQIFPGGVPSLAIVALLVAEGIALTAFRSRRPERASWSLE